MKEHIVTSDDGAAASKRSNETGMNSEFAIATDAKKAVLLNSGSHASNDRRVLPINTYTADSPMRRPLEFLVGMWRDLVASRELAWRLFVRDMRAQYRNSLLGYFWVFIPPLMAALPFIFLNGQGVIKIAATPIPYGAYAMIGTMIWQVFADAINSPLRAVTGAQSMLNRIKFPPEAILLSGLMQVGFSFFVRLLLLVGVFLLYSIMPPVTAFLFPIGILALVLTGFAAGLLLVPIGLLYGDVQRVLTIVLPFVMLMTPVLYPPPESGLAAKFVALNPLNPLVATTRDWLILGTSPHSAGFLAITSIVAIGLVMGWIIYRVALPHIIARIGN